MYTYTSLFFIAISSTTLCIPSLDRGRGLASVPGLNGTPTIY